MTSLDPIIPAPEKLEYKLGESIKLYFTREGRYSKHYRYFLFLEWRSREGDLIGYLGRTKEKITHQIFYTEKGWTQGSLGKDKPLFGLQTLKNDGPVHIHEGEKAWHFANKLLPEQAAVTWVGGAHQPHLSDWSSLANRELLIFPDHDIEGFDAAITIYENLKNKCPEINFVLPTEKTKPKWDIADGIESGWLKEQVQEHINSNKCDYKTFITEKNKRFPLDIILEAKKKFSKQNLILSDKGAPDPGDCTDKILKELNFISDSSGTLYLYQDNCFREISKVEFDNIVISFPSMASSKEDWRNQVRKLLIARVMVRNLEKKWRSIKSHQIPLINGLFDIQTKNIETHKPEHYLESVIKYQWVSGAKNETWENFLQETFDDDPEKILALQEFFGYTLLPRAEAKKCLFCHGVPNSGKSVIGHGFRGLHGIENTCNVSVTQMSDPVALGGLIGKNINLVPEINYGEAIPDAIFKTLIGTEEAIGIRVLYVGYRPYIPFTKHIFLSNNLPIIKDQSNAVIKRILLLKFANMVPDNLIDVDLPKKIMANPEGLLNWAIDGAVRLYENKFQFTEPKSSKQILSEYGNRAGTFEWFIEELCLQDPHAYMPYQQMISLMKKIASEFKRPTELSSLRTQKAITNMLSSYGLKTSRVPDPYRQGQKLRVIEGLTLKNPDRFGQLMDRVEDQSCPEL
jgi:P4 family phage/plasmid primase-like protien